MPLDPNYGFSEMINPDGSVTDLTFKVKNPIALPSREADSDRLQNITRKIAIKLAMNQTP